MSGIGPAYRRANRTVGNRWAIVLAGGFGRRLQSVTEVFAGKPVPKQFCPFGTGQSLLQRTLDRTTPVVPMDRTVVVIDQSMHGVATEQLRDYPGVTIVDQPLERGTGPGILLPLTFVLDLDPAADLLLVPSDHHFRDGSAFRDAAHAAFHWIAGEPSRICLLGVEPDRAATDLGWILPRQIRGVADGCPVAAVERFVEKPPRATAERLLGSGALWNTMIVAARGTELIRLFRDSVPTVTRAFLAGARVTRNERQSWFRGRYRSLPRADFSADVLTTAPNLGVLPVSRRSGWSDLGTPERLFEWIAADRQSAGEPSAADRQAAPHREFVAHTS
jgi:mannose-1-phosphate guanylyltransferase